MSIWVERPELDCAGTLVRRGKQAAWLTDLPDSVPGKTPVEPQAEGSPLVNYLPKIHGPPGALKKERKRKTT
eukprot:298374-Pelagomonas_calceolata.AAC.1